MLNGLNTARRGGRFNVLIRDDVVQGVTRGQRQPGGLHKQWRELC